MTKQELSLILNDIKKVRELLTPEQAIQVPNLFPKLDKNKQIKKGDRFVIDGVIFEALQDIEEAKDKNPINSNKWKRLLSEGGR